MSAYPDLPNQLPAGVRISAPTPGIPAATRPSRACCVAVREAVSPAGVAAEAEPAARTPPATANAAVNATILPRIRDVYFDMNIPLGNVRPWPCHGYMIFRGNPHDKRSAA
ncbi:hypothetical protein GCM10018779_06280 [Streptomyces griseocarneus]|nr:hypothetical protein GCM10018779_06280 [Streptomyces griseocarneus]